MTPLPEPFVQYEGCTPMYTEAKLRQYGADEYKRALDEANVSRYADWMGEAAEDIEFWAAYASDYFIKKHKLEDILADYQNRAAALRKLGETS